MWLCCEALQQMFMAGHGDTHNGLELHVVLYFSVSHAVSNCLFNASFLYGCAH